MDTVIDARGHRCPIPTLRLRRALEQAAPGQRLVLLADDPLRGSTCRTSPPPKAA